MSNVMMHFSVSETVDLDSYLTYFQSDGETWKHGTVASLNLSMLCLAVTGVHQKFVSTWI